MIVRYVSATLLTFIVMIPCAFAQGYNHAIALSGSFTTSSKLFHSPNDPDEDLRSQFLPLNNIFGLGIDYRYTLDGHRFQIGINIEYLSGTTSIASPDPTFRDVPAEDGFRAIPVEASSLFRIPFGMEQFNIYIGGGLGIYVGSREYRYAGVKATTTERTMGAGIHIISGAEYLITGRLAVRTEVKFRDIHFESVNKFPQGITVYNGVTIPLATQPFSSRINIDGMILHLGTVFFF